MHTVVVLASVFCLLSPLLPTFVPHANDITVAATLDTMRALFRLVSVMIAELRDET